MLEGRVLCNGRPVEFLDEVVHRNEIITCTLHYHEPEASLFLLQVLYCTPTNPCTFISQKLVTVQLLHYYHNLITK